MSFCGADPIQGCGLVAVFYDRKADRVNFYRCIRPPHEPREPHNYRNLLAMKSAEIVPMSRLCQAKRIESDMPA